MFEATHLKQMEEAISLFNLQKYWECHESLEDLWMEERTDPVRYVYWAVIQVAAVCIHYRDQNLVGARGMIFKAKEKFRKCREHHVLSPLAESALAWTKLEALALAVPDGDRATLADFKELFEFRFPE